MKSHLVCIEVKAPILLEEREILRLVQKTMQIGLDEVILTVDHAPVVDSTYYDLKNIKIGGSYIVYEKPVHLAVTIGQKLKHCKHGICEVMHISNDGTSLRLKDEHEVLHYGLSPKDCVNA